ncbi:MAG: DarT ssDNA thymidine ADP-ribosyltransferase family protein [Candidatus Hydrogenedentota bacterium]
MLEYKPDYKNIIEELQRRQINCFYHFTLKENLKSIIKARGLLSRNKMRELNIQPTKLHGWGRKGKQEEFASYICLSINLPRGMIKKENRGDIFIFEIDIWVAALSDTLFSLKNTAYDGVELENVKGRDNLESLCDLFIDDDTAKLKNLMSEILIKDIVPLKYVKSVKYFGSLSWKHRLILYRNLIFNLKQVENDAFIHPYPVL